MNFVKFFSYVGMLVHAVGCLYTTSPTWRTSTLVRAGNRNIISSIMGNSTIPTYTFIFSSALSGTPHLGYGVKAYQGYDYLADEIFQVNRTNLNSTSFTVAVQILGFTNILLLNVPYIAIDPSFPHHINSFDNVPVNYSSGPIVNISQYAIEKQTYTNIINYTIQTTGLTYRNFQLPLSRNKILLFLTSLDIFGSVEKNGDLTFKPIDYRVYSQIVSTTQYNLTVTLSTNITINRLHFSMVIFDQTDVLSSGNYMLVYQIVNLPYTGGFIPVPVQFIGSFIMGLLDFSTNKSAAILDFQWDFQTISGVHGVFMPLSIGNTSKNKGNQTIDRVGFTLFYMKTWTCPNTTVETFFDPSQNLCTACPIVNCVDCYNLTVCSSCNELNNFFWNSTSMQCQLCTLQGCLDCLNLTYCSACNSATNYSLVNGACQYCDHTQNIFLNPSSQCQLCSLANCIQCSSLTTCSVCNLANNYYLPVSSSVCSYCNSSSNMFINITTSQCQACSITGCTTCSSLSACLVCNVNGSYYLSATNSTCLYCNSSSNRFIDTVTGQCQSCSLTGCLTCSSLTTCLVCNTVASYSLSLANSTCIYCNSSSNMFINSSNSQCQGCNLVGCLQCSSLTLCSVCNNAMNYYMPPSGTSCLYCNSTLNQFINSSSASCQTCQINACLICSNLTTCLACDSGLGFYLVNGNCYDCVSLGNCSTNNNSTNGSSNGTNPSDNTTNSTQSNNTYNSSNNTTNNTQSNNTQNSSDNTTNSTSSNNTYNSSDNTTNSTQSNNTQNSSNTNSTNSSSDPTNNNTQSNNTNNSSNTNSTNTTQSNSTANNTNTNNITNNTDTTNSTNSTVNSTNQTTNNNSTDNTTTNGISLCGNGMIQFGEDCDDGNNASFDGCSPLCFIQQQSMVECGNTGSKCFSTFFVFRESLIIDKSICNQFTLKFKTNSQEFLSSVHQAYFLNNGLQIINRQKLNNEAVFTVEYNRDIFNETLELQIPFSSLVLKVSSREGLPLLHYESNQCKNFEQGNNFIIGIQVTSFLVLLLSLFSAKIIGLELFGVLQLAYFSLAEHDFHNLYLSFLTKFKIFNGLNIPFMSESPLSKIPPNLKIMDIETSFINNCNIMLLVMFIEFLVAVILNIISRVKQSKKLQSISLCMLKEGFITVVMFNILNISFSGGVHLKYSNLQNQTQIASSILLLFTLLAVAGSLIGMSIFSQSQYGEFKLKFKDNFVCRWYIPISILYRISLGLYIAIKNDYTEASLLVLAFSLAFILYNLINLPFSQAYQNYRCNIMHITQLVTLFCANYYRSMKTNTPMQIKGHIHNPAKIQLGMIVVSIFVSFLAALYEVVLKIRKILRQRLIKNSEDSDTIPKNNATNQTLYQQTTI